MESYSKAAMERAMKVQDVMLQAMAKITWWQAAEILGISDRYMRRCRERYEGGRQAGLPSSNASGARIARAGSADDSGLLSASAWAQRTQLRHLAGTAAARVAITEYGALEAANQFLREPYIAEFNRRFQVAAERGSAFVPCRRRDLERVFSAFRTSIV